jgi:hypothetical protein
MLSRWNFKRISLFRETIPNGFQEHDCQNSVKTDFLITFKLIWGK